MKSRLMLLAVALLLAVLGAVSVLAYVSGADARALKGKKAVSVLIATQRIPVGTTGDRVRAQGYVDKVRMPAETVPADALGALDGTYDTLAVTADVQPRQLMLKGMFGPPERTTGGLAIPDGKLAVTVPMTVPGEVAGYVQPGTQVAVFDTFNMLKGKNVPAGDKLADQHEYNRATRVLLPRIQVLAVGARPAAADAGSGGGQKNSGGDGQTIPVTLAANQSESERLVHGAQTGTLYLALLTDSTDVRPGPGTDNYSLFR